MNVSENDFKIKNVNIGNLSWIDECEKMIDDKKVEKLLDNHDIITV